MVKPPVYHNSKKIFGPSKLSFHYETPCNRMLRALRIMEWISLYQFRIFFTLSIKRKKLYLHSHNLSNLFLRGTPATFIPFLILKMSWATNFNAWYLQNYIFFYQNNWFLINQIVSEKYDETTYMIKKEFILKGNQIWKLICRAFINRKKFRSG